MSSYAVDRTKWSAMPLFEQMGNIYAEVGRTLGMQRRHDTLAAQAAFIRALDLFDATAESLVGGRSKRLREVLRAREQFCTAFTRGTDIGIERYFMHFAMAARLAAVKGSV